MTEITDSSKRKRSRIISGNAIHRSIFGFEINDCSDCSDFSTKEYKFGKMGSIKTHSKQMLTFEQHSSSELG